VWCDGCIWSVHDREFDDKGTYVVVVVIGSGECLRPNSVELRFGVSTTGSPTRRVVRVEAGTGSATGSRRLKRGMVC